MTDVVVGCDINSGNDANVLNLVSKALRDAGYNVETLSIGPGPFANYDWHGPSSGKIGVYLMAPSIVSIADAMCHQGFDRVVFGLRGDLGLRGTREFTTAPWYPDNDCTSVCNKYSGKTGQQIKEMIEPRGTIVLGNTAEEIASNVVKAVGGKSTGSGSSQEQSTTSPLLTGDMTFEELIGEICNGIDLLFLVKRSSVVVTDFSSIFAEAKYLRDNYPRNVEGENIKLWQLEDESYELEINHHGFYNTVIVEYKDGQVKESYDDLVQVFGEVSITYKDPKVDKTTAIMKAKSYLAAHLRDMEVFVKATILSEPDIDIGDIVTIENPKTMKDTKRKSQGKDPEFLFVNGLSTSWEGMTPLTTDIECSLSPTSPEKLEVPTSGNGSGTDNSGGGSGGKFNSCGVSEDGTKLMTIGKPSAVGEDKYGYKLYKSVFERKCPFCGSNELYWGYMWSGNFPCTKKYNNGSAGKYEGHVYCDGCDADFSCIDGKDHMSPPRATLTRISGPDPSSEEEAASLREGKYSG